MAKKKLFASVVLDRSGSMGAITDDTIGSYNSYVKTLAEDKKLDARISLTLFDTQGIDILYEGVKAKDAPLLDRNSYIPRAGTPLFDAIGKTVVSTETFLSKNKIKNVALVIITDGYENSSHEFTKAAIKDRLEQKQEKDNWLVIYLGANQDAWAEGAQFGTQHGNTMSYTPATMDVAFAAAGRSTAVYGSTGKAESFTDEERKKAGS